MLSEEQLKELEEYAALQFSYQECAVILDLDPEKFVKTLHDKKTKEFRSYERGRLLSSATIRKSIFNQAKNGSSPAQKQMLDLIAAVEARNQSHQENEKLNQEIFVFADTTKAGDKYPDKDTSGLFIIVETNIHDKIKIVPVQKITGTLKLYKKEKMFIVDREDLRIVYF